MAMKMVEDKQHMPRLNSQRSIAIDLLRAVAIILVCFCRHLRPCPAGDGSAFQLWMHKVTSTFTCGGWIGVDLFFVLSGFLVSGLLFREHQRYGRISAKDFLIRRGFKIYPGFWILIAISAGIAVLHHRFRWEALFSELLFVQNYGAFFWGHTWSLAVEEHFYFLLVAFLAWLSSRKCSANPFTIVPFSFMVLALVTLLLRLLTAYSIKEFDYWIHQFHSHLRLDSLFFGVLISYLYHYKPEQFISFAARFRWLILVIGVSAVVPAFLFKIETEPWIYIFGFTLFYIGCGALLVFSLVIKIPEIRVIRFAAYLGAHSYSIYLWHGPVGFWLMPRVGRMFGVYWNWPVYAISYIFFVLLVGIVMARVIEFPTLKFRDRLFPSRVGSVRQTRHQGGKLSLPEVIVSSS